jgi:hypothetical protein
MYRRGYRGFGCLPIVVGFFILAMIFSGGFHRPWFFFWPLCFGLPFLVVGLGALCAARRWRGEWPKRKYGDWHYGEKPKRTGDSGSDIYYV